MGNVCRLCRRFIISEAVTFAAGTLTINLPAGSYNNGEKYCIVISQAIPAATTISAPAVITIGDGAEEYPLVNRFGAQVTAAGIRTRTKYATVVSTNATGGSFKMLGNPCCAPDNSLTAIDGTAPAAEGGAGA
jgi:hypothetical protein